MFTLPPSEADRIGEMRNCRVGFTGSSREGKVWPLRKMIAPGISSLTTRNRSPNQHMINHLMLVSTDLEKQLRNKPFVAPKSTE